MTSTAHLTLVDPDLRHRPIDHIVGDGRPSAVRALLARSITMTAQEIERRVRTRLRQPSTEALSSRWRASQRRWSGRAQHDVTQDYGREARAGVVRSGIVLR